MSINYLQPEGSHQAQQAMLTNTSMPNFNQTHTSIHLSHQRQEDPTNASLSYAPLTSHSLLKFKKAFNKKKKQPTRYIGGDKLDQAKKVLSKMKQDKDKIRVEDMEILALKKSDHLE